jgi:acyl-[acyl carrier protein]--UDP-N-acetylglucosamine O-acyltransferase
MIHPTAVIDSDLPGDVEIGPYKEYESDPMPM